MTQRHIEHDDLRRLRDDVARLRLLHMLSAHDDAESRLERFLRVVRSERGR